MQAGIMCILVGNMCFFFAKAKKEEKYSFYAIRLVILIVISILCVEYLE